MRNEVDGDRTRVRARIQALARGRGGELLLDLGDMAVTAEAVRLHVLVDLAVHHLGLGLAPGAGYAALRVDHEIPDQAGAGQGRERQEGRCRVAAGGADERDRCVDEGGELGSMQFRKAVDGHVEELGRRVLEAVPARIVGGVTEPEIRPKVDHRRAGAQEVRHEPGRRAVGEGQEGRVDLGQVGADGQLGRGEVRVMVADRLVLAISPGEPDDLDVGVAAQQPDQLAAAIPGRADDPDADALLAIDAGRPPLRSREDP